MVDLLTSFAVPVYAKARPPVRAAVLGLSKKGELLDNGKEDSYERNPGGVSFVLNHKFLGTFESSEKLAQAGEKTFSTAWARLCIWLHRRAFLREKLGRNC